MVTDSSSSSSDDEQNPKPDPHSIDQSLDAIENQLASISMSQSVSELESESESHRGVKEGTMELNHEELRNGLLNEMEQMSLHDSIEAEGSSVEEDVEVEGDDPNTSSSFAWRNASGAREETEEGLEEPKANSSRLWRNGSEIEEHGAPSSPSSSGYVGERGSSSSTSGIEEVNDDEGEIHEVQNDGEFGDVSDSQAPWVPGKRHGDEVSWKDDKSKTNTTHSPCSSLVLLFCC